MHPKHINSYSCSRAKCQKSKKYKTRHLSNIQLQTFNTELPSKRLVVPTTINKCYKLFFTQYKCPNNNLKVSNMYENYEIHDKTEDGHPYIPYTEIPKNYESLIKGGCNSYVWKKIGKKYTSKDKKFKSWVNDIYNLYTDVAGPRGKCSDLYENRNAHIIQAHDHTFSNMDGKNMYMENGNDYGMYNNTGKSFGSGNRYENGNFKNYGNGNRSEGEYEKGKLKTYGKGNESDGEFESFKLKGQGGEHGNLKLKDYGKGNESGGKHGNRKLNDYGNGNESEGEYGKGNRSGRGNDFGGGKEQEQHDGHGKDNLNKGGAYGINNRDKTGRKSDSQGSDRGKRKQGVDGYDNRLRKGSRYSKDIKLRNKDKKYDQSKDSSDGKGNLVKNDDVSGSGKKVGKSVTINEGDVMEFRQGSISKKGADYNYNQRNAYKNKNTDENTDKVDADKNLRNKKQNTNIQDELMTEEMLKEYNLKNKRNKKKANNTDPGTSNLKNNKLRGGKNKKQVPPQWGRSFSMGGRKKPRPTRITQKSIHALPLLYHYPYDKKTSITYDSQHPDRLRLIRGSKIGPGYLPHYKDIKDRPNVMQKYRKSDLFGKKSFIAS